MISGPESVRGGLVHSSCTPRASLSWHFQRAQQHSAVSSLHSWRRSDMQVALGRPCCATPSPRPVLSASRALQCAQCARCVQSFFPELQQRFNSLPSFASSNSYARDSGSFAKHSWQFFFFFFCWLVQLVVCGLYGIGMKTVSTVKAGKGIIYGNVMQFPFIFFRNCSVCVIF